VRKQFGVIWEELTRQNAHLPQGVDEVRHPEIFLPWTNVTSTGFLMAEILKFHRRGHQKLTKRTEDGVGDGEDREESEGEEEEDLEMIKEDVAKEITRKLDLFRTSASLKWNLTGISLLVLQFFKSQEL
jgi:hypothetical protein